MLRFQTALLGVFCLGVSACGSIDPEPLTGDELLALAEGRLASVVSPDEEPVTMTIGLYEAMARALHYNLDREVEFRQEAVRLRELRLSEYDMLPDLVANLESTTRSNSPGSRSVTVETGATSALHTRSSADTGVDGDLTLTFDVLDFGISYFRSRQLGNDVMIALEQRRSATNRIIEDTRTAYWRVVSAQRLLDQVRTLQIEGRSALNRSGGLISDASGDPRQQLEFQRDILRNDQALEQLARDLQIAQRQLAALMNLRIGQTFRVEMPQRGRHRSDLNMTTEQMLMSAMLNRPELREVTYRQRNNELEGPISTLEAIPGLNLFLSSNFDDNDLLLNGSWVTTGSRVSWNLMRVLRLPERQRNIEAGGELLDARALALTQAVATQVIVARARYHSLHREFHTSEAFLRVQRQLTNQVQREYQAGSATQQEVLNERFNLLIAELQTDLAFADMQNAFANLYAAMGLDSYDGRLTGNETLAQTEQILAAWWHERGDHTIQ